LGSRRYSFSWKDRKYRAAHNVWLLTEKRVM
jgi:hypothetical protein